MGDITMKWAKVNMVLVMSVVLCILGGCTAPARSTVESNVGTIQVDLVAVFESNKNDWLAMDMDKYWEANSPLRQVAIESQYLYPMYFEYNRDPIQKFPGENPDNLVWKKWKEKNPQYLFILTNLRPIKDQSFKDMGRNDPRRKVIPLYGKCWKDPEIDIRITQTGIEVKSTRINLNKRECQCD
jgi:hypothetical protein